MFKMCTCITFPYKTVKSRNQRGHQEAKESLNARAEKSFEITQNHFIIWTQNFGDINKWPKAIQLVNDKAKVEHKFVLNLLHKSDSAIPTRATF